MSLLVFGSKEPLLYHRLKKEWKSKDITDNLLSRTVEFLNANQESQRKNGLTKLITFCVHFLLAATHGLPEGDAESSMGLADLEMLVCKLETYIALMPFFEKSDYTDEVLVAKSAGAAWLTSAQCRCAYLLLKDLLDPPSASGIMTPRFVEEGSAFEHTAAPPEAGVVTTEAVTKAMEVEQLEAQKAMQNEPEKPEVQKQDSPADENMNDAGMAEAGNDSKEGEQEEKADEAKEGEREKADEAKAEGSTQADEAKADEAKEGEQEKADEAQEGEQEKAQKAMEVEQLEAQKAMQKEPEKPEVQKQDSPADENMNDAGMAEAGNDSTDDHTAKRLAASPPKQPQPSWVSDAKFGELLGKMVGNKIIVEARDLVSDAFSTLDSAICEAAKDVAGEIHHPQFAEIEVMGGQIQAVATLFQSHPKTQAHLQKECEVALKLIKGTQKIRNAYLSWEDTPVSPAKAKAFASLHKHIKAWSSLKTRPDSPAFNMWQAFGDYLVPVVMHHEEQTSQEVGYKKQVVEDTLAQSAEDSGGIKGSAESWTAGFDLELDGWLRKAEQTCQKIEVDSLEAKAAAISKVLNVIFKKYC